MDHTTEKKTDDPVGWSTCTTVLPWIDKWLAGATGRATPLLIGISSPQGGGKTTLTRNLVTALASRGIRAVAMSLDDFYLPHADLVALAAANPENRLVHGRGLPGTHDVGLLVRTLEQLQHGPFPVNVPVYDKSAHGGQGDRSPDPAVVAEPVRVVLLEGWMLGFRAPRTANGEVDVSGVPVSLLDEYGSANVCAVAGAPLDAYGAVHAMLDHFVHLTPRSVQVVYAWRAQQEQELRAARGAGMSDDQVRAFVGRYMPLYELCVPVLLRERLWGPSGEEAAGAGKVHLRILVDDARRIEKVETVD
ncbi:hypothetical protein H9P43_004280 [Blastocladiella emersonii ATCC 22665]|nr:hypothetical protein H9P43_004280 [Blastocladiella emersonii ATCC 22665]